MRPIVLLLAVLVSALAACGGNDDAAPGDPAETTAAGTDRRSSPRLCDAYLRYIAEPSELNLDMVGDASDDDEIDELVEIIGSDADTRRVLAAEEDLQSAVRARCQAEWIAGAQGAGNTAAAAEAFFDALVAGDRVGARNVASANAIARFMPWEPLEPEDGTPALAEVGDDSFTVVLDPESVARCQVETGVVIACSFLE